MSSVSGNGSSYHAERARIAELASILAAGTHVITNTQTTMAQRKNVVHTAEVVRHGEKLIVPTTMELNAAVEVLNRKILEEEQVVDFSERIIAFPWEGALAFKKALDEMFGSSLMKPTKDRFGNDVPPAMIAVETGPDTKVMVPWGKFPFPLDDSGHLVTDWTMHDNRVVFCISGKVKRKWLATISKLADLTRDYALRESIYRGKALRISFDEPLPTPKFMDLREANLDEMVYTQELTALIESNIMTPLRHADECRKAGIPLKRGILAAGPYGTGKSLLARAVAKVGTEAGWTFIYIKDAGQLPSAIQFAQLYQPAVIFAEDVDRHVTGERTDAMDQILNTLDGIDTKTAELMVVLTTNHLDQINRAMLRPGRLDVILNITAPDAEAVQRLIKVYARGRLAEDTNLEQAAAMLAGYTPAIVREVVERAKLTCISRTGKADSPLTGDDISLSAKTMVQQQALLKAPEPKPTEWHTGLVEAVAHATKETLHGNGVGKMISQVQEIHEHTV